MLPSVSVLPQIGLAVLFLATVVWAVGLVRMLRRDRLGVAPWRTPEAQNRKTQGIEGTEGTAGAEGTAAAGGASGTEGADGAEGAGRAQGTALLPAVPRQAGPPSERVELSADERAAFEGLVRRLTARN